MDREKRYTAQVGMEHVKRYGQYFTPAAAARFMCRWACPGARTVLDPAAGNSIFLKEARQVNPAAELTGYEIDPEVIDFFGNPAEADLRLADYLLSDWDARFDAIVANPPYGRFQSVTGREDVLAAIESHTGVRYTRYTNLYAMFLIKSISQLSEHGRLAYLVPSEFLNSSYGTAVKQIFLDSRLLRAVIGFREDAGLFAGAVTTCCVLLLDREPKDAALFGEVNSPEELEKLDLRRLGAGSLDPGKLNLRRSEPGKLDPGRPNPEKMFSQATDSDDSAGFLAVPYSELRAEDKWRTFVKREGNARHGSVREGSKGAHMAGIPVSDDRGAGVQTIVGRGAGGWATGTGTPTSDVQIPGVRGKLCRLSDFCTVSRGIATGANDYFCLTASEVRELGLPASSLTPCVSLSRDVRPAVFRREDFDALAAADRKVYLFDPAGETFDGNTVRYLEKGTAEGIPGKYIPAHRKIWYRAERQEPAPIWLSSACRGSVKCVRNLAGVRVLTTFHCVYVREEFRELTDVLFCCLLTPTAQRLLLANRKELGTGLAKFQPGDLMGAEMLDLTQLPATTIDAVREVYREMPAGWVARVERILW